jgi:hypothetical protein
VRQKKLQIGRGRGGCRKEKGKGESGESLISFLLTVKREKRKGGKKMRENRRNSGGNMHSA